MTAKISTTAELKLIKRTQSARATSKQETSKIPLKQLIMMSIIITAMTMMKKTKMIATSMVLMTTLRMMKMAKIIPTSIQIIKMNTKR